MEDDQNGRRPKWKTTKMEDHLNERRPKLKTTSMEVNKIEDNIKKYKKQELCDNKNVERSICPPLRHFPLESKDGG